ncbi:2-C-methyl-D-erythritol 4-phosphate cytidylyltransferase [Candidatus Entotheonella palauensis]|uniref:2-C-methyl-D-erythritol 4-phosphate cytidylyltransferase n=1 Tax=Candidatus Entotheonella palauensis TaxID=93172 RepID=UPI0021178583|nr:2-C-methyl-D-erythritol 4-phosphate cytidylyltransferase [Candidatus Entotheonella palauensis]
MKGHVTGRRVAALIPAAGSGQRMGSATPKPYLLLGRREILARTLEVFETCAAVHDVWVIASAEQQQHCRQGIVERHGFGKVRGVVAGGDERQASVWRGLQQLAPEVDLVVIHDGVRPFVSHALIEDAVEGAAQHGAAIAAVPLKDTIKRVSRQGQVEATVPRDRLWRIQTPQAFRRQLLQQAFEQAWQQRFVATDEAGLIEAYGHSVYVVQGSERNVKITTPDDLAMCERLIEREDHDG